MFSGLQRPLALARGIGLRALHLLLRIREGVSGANQFDSFNQYLNLCNQHLIPVREELTVQKGKQMGKQSPYNQLSGVKEVLLGIHRKGLRKTGEGNQKSLPGEGDV